MIFHRTPVIMSVVLEKLARAHNSSHLSMGYPLCDVALTFCCRLHAALSSTQINSTSSTAVMIVTPSHRLRTPPMFDHSTSLDIDTVSLTRIGTFLFRTTFTCRKFFDIASSSLSWLAVSS